MVYAERDISMVYSKIEVYSLRFIPVSGFHGFYCEVIFKVNSVRVLKGYAVRVFRGICSESYARVM